MSSAPPTPIPFSREDIQRLFADQQDYAPIVRATGPERRKEKLERLCRELRDRRSEIQSALQADFQKAPIEVDLTELNPLLTEARHAIDTLDNWMSPQKVGSPLLFTGTHSEILYEPKGVALIISPWNYPLLLTLGPLVAAIAAGNCAVLKPSEFTPHTNAVLRSLLAEVFEEHEVAVRSGNSEVAQLLLDKPFDHVYFTGSTRVGRLVMKAAAEHPTSITLELGGKSPTIVDSTATLNRAAERVAWGKFTNAGQTCIAPDYVLVDESVHDAFVRRLSETIRQFYGESPADRKDSDDYARMIRLDHWQHVVGLLDDAVEAGATVAIGGQRDAESNYVSPTVLTEVSPDTRIMQEEIFGPVLPVLSVRSMEDALQIINDRPDPLSIYLFSEEEAAAETVLAQTSAGSTCINEVLLHFANPELPFGGTGESGVGRGHGEAGFRAFSNERSVLHRSYASRFVDYFYPPYDGFTKRLVDTVLRYL